MENQISRILNSSLNVEIIDSIHTNQEQIMKMESILKSKNSHIFQLQSLVKHQLETTIQQNAKLKKSNHLYKREIKYLRNQLKELRNYSLHFQKIVQDQFHQAVSSVKEASSKGIAQKCQLEMIDSSAQTEEIKKVIDPKVYEKISTLEETIIRLKQEKWQLNKQLQKIQANKFPTESQQEYHSCSSSDNEIDKIKNILSLNQLTKIKFSMYEQYISPEMQKKYQGNLMNGQKNGEGICNYQHNFVYEGVFVSNRKHGLGILKFDEQIIYQGYWKNSLPYGKGNLYFPFHENVERVCGHFADGKLEGYGTIVYRDGRKIRGLFKQGQIDNSKALLEEEGEVLYGKMLGQNRFQCMQSRQIVAI